MVDENLEINGVGYKVTCLSVGNPHCAIPSGSLFVEINENEDIYLTGSVEGIFEGCFAPDLKEEILRMKW